jgi:hypothetical protein
VPESRNRRHLPSAKSYGLAMTDEPVRDEKRMRLRFAGTCRVCSVELPAKTEAVFERVTKTVRCTSHDVVAPEPRTEAAIDPGTPGASARREFDRRRANREQRIRNKHPKIGGLLSALSDEPQ